jgi:hypothetical protein
MKFRFILLAIVVFFIFFGCPQKETPYFSHVYGWVRGVSFESTGVNGVVLQIRDINPENPEAYRYVEVTTQTLGSRIGSFDLDSVCYGTSGYMTSELVRIYCDSLKNPAWKTQWWFPTIMGELDSITLNIVH